MRAEHLVERVDHLADLEVLDLADRAREVAPEIAQQVAPFEFVVGDAVELVLEAGGEIVFDVAREKILQERDHDAAAVLRDQPPLVEADVLAVLEDLQDRGVGGRPADAELFHALDERGFRIARRRLGEVLRGIDRAFLQRLALAHLGELAGLVVLRLVVAAFLVDLEEAVELRDGAGGAQIDVAGARLGGDVDGGALELGRLHLAGDGAHPDQLIELGLVGLEEFRDLARPAGDVGRTDRLMRLLGVLRLGLVAARRFGNVTGAVIGVDHAADLAQRLVGHVDAVGPHISNESDRLAAEVDSLVEPLRDAHGVGRGKAELAARLLLQRRGGEGRIGVAPGGLGVDQRHREGGGLERLLERLGLRPRADVEALDLLAVGADQPRLEGLAARRRERRDQRPVLARDEFLDLELAVAHQPQRDRLHAAGRARARQLAPEHRRQREADEIVERAARQIGVDQRLVDGARVLHRLAHRLLGDGVEDDALDVDILEKLLFLEHFQHVPGDRLALAVGVGGENELVGALDRPGDVGEALLRLAVHLPDHVEVGLRIDRAVLGGQVTHMAKGRQHLVAAAEVFIDRFCLGRRLDNDYVHERSLLFRNLARPRSGIGRPPSRGKMGKSPPRVKSPGAFAGCISFPSSAESIAIPAA